MYINVTAPFNNLGNQMASQEIVFSFIFYSVSWNMKAQSGDSNPGASDCQLKLLHVRRMSQPVLW